MLTDPADRAVLNHSFAMDPLLTQRQMRRFAERLANPLHASMVEAFREHMYQEMVELDIDKLMGTMVDQPELHYHGIPDAPDLGYDAVRAHYTKSFPARAQGGVTIDVHRLAVDDESLYFDGVAIFSVEFVAQHFGLEVRTDRRAVLTKRFATIAPFDDGRIVLEAQYFDGPVTDHDLVFLDD